MECKTKEYGISKFASLEFTTAVGCKLNCKYCPQKLFIKRYNELFEGDNTVLDFNDFKKILSRVQEGGTITFSGMVEPFTNPNCAKMIKYAADNGYKVSLFTTLMGIKMSDMDLISDVDFSVVTLHIPDLEQNAHFEMNKQYFEVLERFVNKIEIEFYSCHGTVHPEVEKYLKKDKYIASKMNNRAGNLQCNDVLGVDKRGKKNLVCGAGTAIKAYGYTPVVLPNGIVTLCCMDFGLRHILGNALTQSVNEIFGGNEFCNVTKGMHCGQPEVLCHTCSAARNDLEYTGLFYLDAIKTGNLISEYACGRSGKLDMRKEEILKLLTTKKNICIYGLGRLFQENYFASRWCDVLKANLFSDGNSEKWGKEVCGGAICVAPNQLWEIEDLLIITYVKNDQEIRNDLRELNADFINIYEIFNLFRNIE